MTLYTSKVIAQWLSETWDAVLQGGVLVECKVSLTIEEYL